MKNQKGITLIALIITIIVMLILVGVSVSVAINTGLFKTASGVSKDTEEQKANELKISGGQANLNGVYTNIEEYAQGLVGGNKDFISETDSYAKDYYLDVNGVIGIVYADLAFKEGAEEKDFKSYSINGTHNDPNFGEKPLLKAESNGDPRFYVMALEDFTGDYYWYYSAAEHENTAVVTSDAFETGKSNTDTMIGIWNREEFGEQNGDPDGRKDIWGAIQTKVSQGWFVPSLGEWNVFVGTYDVQGEQDDDGNWPFPYGFWDMYWTSSQNNKDVTLDIYGSTGGGYNDAIFNVRLSATF